MDRHDRRHQVQITFVILAFSAKLYKERRTRRAMLPLQRLFLMLWTKVIYCRSGDIHHTYLACSIPVPVYDARKHAFNYAGDFDKIAKILPSFDGEVPAGSFAVVAYTLSCYKKAENWHLSSNVQFVIVLATE